MLIPLTYKYDHPSSEASGNESKSNSLEAVWKHHDIEKEALAMEKPKRCKVVHHYANHWMCLSKNVSCPYLLSFDDDHYCIHSNRQNFA